MTNELKPCPFCGGEAMSYDYEAGNFYPNYIVECCNCSARIKPVNADSYDAEKKAVKEWNTRQPAFDWKPIEELDLVLLMEGKQMVLLNKKRPFVNAYGFICEDTYEEYGEDVHSLWDDMKTDATHYALLTPPQTNQS